MRELLGNVQDYAVAAINIVDFLSMKSVIKTAEKCNSPIIIQTSPKTVKHWAIHEIASWYKVLAEKATVPVVLHLDHCVDLDFIEACARGGWTSVMYDGSALPFEENLANTQKVVAMAHPINVSVEGEIGAIGGVEDDKVVDEDAACLADPEQAVRLGLEADLDVLAPAIGTAHGAYKKTPHVNVGILEKIREKWDRPMALHGGTGLSDEVFHACIARGCTKVNISTQLKITGIDSVYAYIDDHRREYNPLKVQAAQQVAYEQMVENFLRIFKSIGTAAK